MPGIFQLYSTFENEAEAVSIAEILLNEHLIACANITQARSLYRWEGTLENTTEAMMVAKTSEAKLPAAIARITSLHSYDVPCIVAYPISDGHTPFVEWVKSETR